jgi:hypothetical protein
MKLYTMTAMMAATAQTFGAIAYIDMGISDTILVQGDVQSDGNHWTTVANGAAASVLVTDGGAALTWNVAASGFNDSTNTGSPAVFIPGGDDALWTDGTASFTISGLDATGAETYDLSFYGSRTADAASATYEAVGFTTSNVDQLNQGPPPATAVSLLGVQANASGEILVNVTIPNSAPYAFTNAFSIESQSVPEPSSAALLGLGGFALILRRRR